MFDRNTGMDIALVNVEECPLTGNLDGKHKIQQLRIWSDVQWDGIPVQCAAIRSSPELLDHFSPYAVLSVESDGKKLISIPSSIDVLRSMNMIITKQLTCNYQRSLLLVQVFYSAHVHVDIY